MLSYSEIKLYWMKVSGPESKRILLFELTSSARCGELASLVSSSLVELTVPLAKHTCARTLVQTVQYRQADEK